MEVFFEKIPKKFLYVTEKQYLCTPKLEITI